VKRKNRIHKILKKKLFNFDIIIEDNSFKHKGHNNFDGKQETHISLILKEKNKTKINKLEIHRLINNVLADEFKTGLHSLEIKII
jgi:Stress-induced morphogen (activity unknown)